MRCVASVLLLIGFVSAATAADYSAPPLRGMTTLEPDPLYSAPPVVAQQRFVPGYPHYSRWDGYYVGGQLGYSAVKYDLSKAAQPLFAQMLQVLTLEDEQHVSSWPLLSKASDNGVSYGGFAGYNMQWEDAIIGVEAAYNHYSMKGASQTGSLNRRVPAGGNIYDVSTEATASVNVTDVFQGRLRGGWAAGAFMPYATVGFAMGLADVNRSASISGTETRPDGSIAYLPNGFAAGQTLADSQKGAFFYGYTVGGGVDVMLLQNVFLRGEVEYLAFFPIKGGITGGMVSARVGGGLKF